METTCKQCGEKKELSILHEFCSARCAGMWANSAKCEDSIAFCTKVMVAHGEAVTREVMATNKDGARYRGGYFPILW